MSDIRNETNQVLAEVNKDILEITELTLMVRIAREKE